MNWIVIEWFWIRFDLELNWIEKSWIQLELELNWIERNELIPALISGVPGSANACTKCEWGSQNTVAFIE